MVVGHGGKLDLIRQTEERVDLVKKLRNADDLVLYLILGKEDVRVVLREAAYAEHAVQRAGQLMAVDDAQLAVAQGQLLIGVRLQLVHEDAAGAVHGLYREILAVDDGGVHIILIVIPVAGGLPQGAAHDLRGGDLHIVPLSVHLAPVVDEGVFQHHALGQVEREAGRLIAEREQTQLTPELAVVAALCLLNAGEVLVQLVLLREGDAVDALKRLAAAVPAPVGAVAGGELDGVALYSAGGVKVGTGAEVGELTLLIKTDDRVLGQIVYKLDLIRLVLLLHEPECFLARQLKAFELELFFADLAHLALDLLHYFRGKGEGRVHIVVKAVLYRGADGKLDLRVQALDRLRQHVGAGVPVGVAVFGIFKAELVFGVFHVFHCLSS